MRNAYRLYKYFLTLAPLGLISGLCHLGFCDVKSMQSFHRNPLLYLCQQCCQVSARCFHRNSNLHLCQECCQVSAKCFQKSLICLCQQCARSMQGISRNPFLHLRQQCCQVSAKCFQKSIPPPLTTVLPGIRKVFKEIHPQSLLFWPFIDTDKCKVAACLGLETGLLWLFFSYMLVWPGSGCFLLYTTASWVVQWCAPSQI